MIIGIYLENYRSGGLDRVVTDILTHWKNPSDQLVLFCNDTHEGLNHLKTDTAGRALVVTYRTPWFMRHFSGSSHSHRIWRLFYKAVFCYIGMFTETLNRLFLFRKYGIQALFIHNGGWPAARTTRSAAIAGALLRIKTNVLIIHSMAAQHPFYIYLQETLMEAALLGLSVTIATVSNAAASSIKRHTLFSQVAVIPNGIRNIELSQGKDIRSELNLDKSTFLIGMFGTLEPLKGHAFMLEALSLIKKEIPGAVLLIVGSGTFEEKFRVEREIKRLNLSAEVKMLGFRRDALEIMRELQVVVSPSQAYESFGLVNVEAMALQIPVVATDVGGMPEVVENGVTGFIVSAKDAAACAQKIIHLAKNPTEARRMGKAGGQRYKAYFKASQMSQRYQELTAYTS